MLETITQKITDTLTPSVLELYDDSNDHRGHAAFKEGVATHLGLLIVSDAFAGKGRIERQRMVYKCLDDALAQGLHAVTRIKTYTEAEYKAQQDAA